MIDWKDCKACVYPDCAEPVHTLFRMPNGAIAFAACLGHTRLALLQLKQGLAKN